jgi:hypothetical protein
VPPSEKLDGFEGVAAPGAPHWPPQAQRDKAKYCNLYKVYCVYRCVQYA